MVSTWSMMRAVVWAPLPYRDPERLVLVAAVALWASWFPALRAAGVDPARAVQGG